MNSRCFVLAKNFRNRCINIIMNLRISLTFDTTICFRPGWSLGSSDADSLSLCLQMLQSLLEVRAAKWNLKFVRCLLFSRQCGSSRKNHGICTFCAQNYSNARWKHSCTHFSPKLTSLSVDRQCYFISFQNGRFGFENYLPFS